MNCKEFEDYLTLDLYGDLPPEQRAPYEAHLAGCVHCQATREKVRGLHEVLAQRPRLEPSPDFLVECRQALAEALDEERLGWRGLIREWLPFLELPPPQVAPRLAFALSLMVFGFGLGWMLRPHAARMVSSQPGSVTASSLADSDFENMRINDISRVAPDPQTGDVRITMDAQRRVTLQGSLDDPRIQQLLVYAVKSYDNAGIRRDTLDALRARTQNPNVRAALLYSLEHDPNVGNRLAALDAVRGMAGGKDLQQSLIEVLEHDKNMGVRVESVDVLVDLVEKQGRDEAVLSALERLATGDSNRYVRLKCASALRKLGSNGF
jgi:anti-sigma factor RsiW